MRSAKATEAPLIFTTYDIGRMTGTDPTTVHKWIDKGLMRGYRTPGGHRRVRAEDLKAFLVSHSMPIPRELGGAEGMHLVVVDPDAESLKQTIRALKRIKPAWEAIGVDNSVDALLTVAGQVPDVLVFELNDGEVDGLALCRHLRARVETDKVKLIAVTERHTAELQRKVLAAGADACLKKPVAGPDLVGCIETVSGLRPAAEVG